MDRARPLHRHLVEHPQEAEHLGDRTHSRCYYRKREALYGLCRAPRLQRRAGRGMEPGMGRGRKGDLSEDLSGFRHRGSLPVWCFQRCALYRAYRDMGTGCTIGGGDGRSLRLVLQTGHPGREDGLCGTSVRRKGTGQVAIWHSPLPPCDRVRRQASYYD